VQITRRDALLAAGLAVLVQVELWLTEPRAGSAVAALAVLALAAARAHPEAALCSLVGALLVDTAAGGSLSMLDSPLLAVIVGCLLAGRWTASAVRVAAVAAVAVVAMTTANQIAPEQTYSALDDLVFFALALGTPTLIGRMLRLRAGSIRELAARAEALRAVRAAEAAAAVAEERARLAIGVHDALAQRIGEIALQAAGAQRLAGREPARALAALARIEATARAALEDIRQVVGVLRRGDGLLDVAGGTAQSGALPAPWRHTARPPRCDAEADPALPRTASDIAVAVAVFAAMTVETLTSSQLEGPVAANVVGMAAIAAPLAFRRRVPLVSAVATLGAATVQGLLLTEPTMLVTPIVVLLLPAYSVAAYLSLRPAIAGLLVCLAGTIAIEAPGPALVAALAWLAGRGVRERGRRVEELRGITRRLELSADAHAARARGEERLRIARELHDAVAHSMTVIVLQAEAAQRLWAEQPAVARSASAAVGEVARETLSALRSRLRLQESRRLEDLDGLVARMRTLGLDVTVTHRPGPVPAAIDHVAFSVLQEALTNVARHAAPTSVSVDVRRDADAIRIEVTDAGRASAGAPPAAIPGTGTGLRGMSERVTACGGELRYGPAGSGFRVEARLPLEGAAAA